MNRSTRLRLLTCICALISGFLLSPAALAADETVPVGERIYAQHCASCHGDAGQGVKGEYSKPLHGSDSVAQLARYIERWMPEDEPELVVGEDAKQVARYIYDAFYSPIAQARHAPPRIELTRLTVRQYRNAVADLVASFRGDAPRHEQQGLEGEYFKGRRLDRDEVLERIDPEVRFDFGAKLPDLPEAPEGKEFDPRGFSVRWEGSVTAPETGDYEFILRTDHAGRLWVNDLDEPLIDAWVKSGDDIEYRGSLFLVGGRSYGIRLEFSCHKQGVDDSDKRKKQEVEPLKAFVELQWKRPHHVAEVIAARHLSPRRSPEVFALATPFPPDDRSVGYERGTRISQAWTEATTSAALATASYVADHLNELADTKDDAEDRQEKVRQFAARWVERAFRRPLSDPQRQLYVERQFEDAPDLETAIKRIVLLSLKSPRFLYLDPGDEDADVYQVASRLSFAMWDSLPDQGLLDAAAAGKLATREQIAEQASRMIDDPRAHAKVREFLHSWLNVEHAGDLGKNSELYPEFNAAIASDLRTSLDLFLDDVITSDGADFRRLLLSNELYINGRLAKYYGYDLPDDAPFQQVEAKQPQRLGVLSHPFIMATFAYSDASSPIHRGVFMARSVLGRGLRPPPEAVAPLAPDLHPNLTTRDRVVKQTSPEACQSCHTLINSLGFALENFDAVGRFRETEKDKPVDTSGYYELPDGGMLNFNGPRELAEFLAKHAETQRAFGLQLFHHMVKQPITAYGVHTPDELRDQFEAADFNIRKLVVEIATRAALGGEHKETQRAQRQERSEDRGQRSEGQTATAVSQHPNP